ncbi:MAG: anaerobic sulfatase maturase [Candidatus Bathyarchaeia archaeon]
MREDGTSIPSVLVKPVSADCNLACTYCFYSSKARLYPETMRHRMSDRVLRELIAQVMVLSCDRASFCWQGGEPTLAGLDFYRKVVKYESLFGIRGQMVQNSIQTNGTLINEEWVRFLGRYNFLVGVSLDGPQELHNFYRRDRSGRPSYERVMEGIEWLKRYDVDFNILVLLNKRNIQHPRELYRFLLEQGFRHLQFIPCVESDQEHGGPAEYSITPEQYGEFLCTLFDEWTREGIPQVYIREFDEILISYVTGEAPNCTFSKECGKYIVVEYNGDVYPCDFYVEPRWFLGNLTEQPLEEIIAGEKFTEFRLRKNEIAQNCGDCRWLQYCHGGCPKHWTVLGLDHNYFCSSYQMLFQHSHRRFLRLKRTVEQKGRGEIKNFMPS